MNRITSISIDREVIFRAEHPFLYFIFDTVNAVPTFIGSFKQLKWMQTVELDQSLTNTKYDNSFKITILTYLWVCRWCSLFGSTWVLRHEIWAESTHELTSHPFLFIFGQLLSSRSTYVELVQMHIHIESDGTKKHFGPSFTTDWSVSTRSSSYSPKLIQVFHNKIDFSKFHIQINNSITIYFLFQSNYGSEMLLFRTFQASSNLSCWSSVSLLYLWHREHMPSFHRKFPKNQMNTTKWLFLYFTRNGWTNDCAKRIRNEKKMHLEPENVRIPQTWELWTFSFAVLKLYC